MKFEEFIKLSENEKVKEYKNLSDHDKFLARISSVEITETIEHSELTSEEKEAARKRRKNDYIVDITDDNIGEITKKIFNGKQNS